MRQIEFAEFRAKHLETLGVGDTAFYAHNAALIYPPDVSSHKATKAGAPPEFGYGDFPAKWGAAIKAGACIKRLRVLPPIGWEGYDQRDVEVVVKRLEVLTAVGEETRYSWLDDVLPALDDSCGSDSPLVQGYLQGHETGNPSGGFWSFRRDGALESVAFLHYKNGSIAPVQVVEAPQLTPDQAAYTTFWQEVYDKQSITSAEALSALALNATGDWLIR